jgi:flagellar basal-body rod modification protein FlgD
MDAITQIRTDSNLVNRSLSTPGSDLGKDEFLRLLVTQMQNQDPVNPMDSSQFASQLAQFNSVEQLINVNTSLDNMSKSQEIIGAGLSNTLAASLPGKQVKAYANVISFDGTKPVEFGYNLESTADAVKITISNENGDVLRTVNLDSKGPGEHTWEWDGKTTDGKSLPAGDYTIKVEASDGDASVNSNTFIYGTVDRVKYTPTGVQLLVNGAYIGLGDVEEIGA